MEGSLTSSDVSTEDGGRAKLTQINCADSETLFVRIQSWSETKEHPDFDSLIGRRVRVTIETVDDDEKLHRIAADIRREYGFE